MKINNFWTEIRCTGMGYADFGLKSAAQAWDMLILACENIKKTLLAVFGSIFGVFGVPLGSLLGVFGSILGVFGVPLGYLWGTFGSLWGYFGVTLAVLGPFGDNFRALWHHLGRI
jgi:hypothetical protein